MHGVAEIVAIGHTAGLAAVGVTDAKPFSKTRVDLEQRKSQGLCAQMQFTYRNPARSTNPRQTMHDATAIIVGAYDYQRLYPLPEPEQRPLAKVATYSSQDHYSALRSALLKIAEALLSDGFKAQVVADENNLVDRAVAYRAGIGWWGKSSNILIHGVGSMVVLGSVLTNAPLEPNPTVVEDACKSCRKCIDGCPTGAIIASGVVDANKCLAWLLQAPGVFPLSFRELLGNRIYGCDDCQDVCPPNRIRRKKPSLQGDTPWVAILDMLELSDEELMKQFGRWYIANRDPNYLRRNALVVLGNIGAGEDKRTVNVLVEMLTHQNEIVVAHAVWATRKLNRNDLLGMLDVSMRQNTTVVAELQRPVNALR